MPGFLKKRWLFLLTFALTSAILVSFLCAKTGFGSFFGALKAADARWFAASAALILSYWLLDAFTLHIFTLMKTKSFRLYDSFRITMLGLLYNALTPFAAGGQAVQIYEMNKTGVSAGTASAVITTKSLLFQSCALLYATLCSAFMWRYFSVRINHFPVYMVFGIICNALFIAALLTVCLSRKLAARLAAIAVRLLVKMKIIKNHKKALSAALGQIKLFRKSMRAALDNKRVSLFCFLTTMLQLTFLYAIPYAIYRAFHFSDGVFYHMIAANAIISMITAFIPLPGKAGAAEGSFYIFFRMFFPEELLPPVITLWRATSYYSCILFGAIISLFDLSLKPLLRKRRERNKAS